MFFEEVVFSLCCLSAHPVHTPPKKIKEEKEYITFPHQTLSVLHAHRTSPTHTQTNSITLLSVVVVVVRAHILNCSVVVTLLIRGGGKKKI